MSPRLTVVALAVSSLLGCGPSQPRYSAELLAKTARQLPRLDAKLTAIELVLPFDQLFDSPKQQHKQLGTLRVGAQKYKSPVVLDSIGNLSRLICSYPKLAIALPGRSGPRTRLFLTPHCADGIKNRDSLPDERQLPRHFAAYKLQRALGLPTLRACLVQVSYRDTRSSRVIAGKPALLVEDLADLGRRLGSAKPVQLREQLPTRLGYHDLDATETARFHLFQVLINNPDWILFELKPVSRYARERRPPQLHNAAVVNLVKGKIPVAFDFDLSSLAGVPEAVRLMTSARYRHFLWAIVNPHFLSDTSELLRWMVIRLQHFRRRHDRQIATRAAAHFLQRRSALLSAITTLPPEATEPARKHVDTFFEALAQHGDLPHVIKATPLYRDSNRTAKLCQTVTPATPLQLLDPTTSNGLLRVRLIQYLVLRQQEPHTVAACKHKGRAATPDVGWIDAKAVSRPSF